MARRSSVAALLLCLGLGACGTPDAASERAAPFRLDPRDVYPTGGGPFAIQPPPGAPACLGGAGRGFASEGAFADCRRDLAVYQAALDLWRGRIAGLVAREARAKNGRALATFACKLAGAGPCAPVGYGTEAADQPRPPACVGDALPLVFDDGGVAMENCRYGVAQYRDNLTEWARRAGYGARVEADARLEAAVDRFNCKLLAEPYRGAACLPGAATSSVAALGG